MNECIFCKIVNNKINATKVYEDKEFLAILDIHPNTKGMTLVLTKKHYNSYAFDMPNNIYSKLMLKSKDVAKILEKALKVKRVAMVMEGMGVDHVHIKLYPLYGLTKKFEETWTKDKIFFDYYRGHISTKLGPNADPKELKKLAEKIR